MKGKGPSVQVRETMHAVNAAHPKWYRAAHSGQRVTLASLFRNDVLERRAWRGQAGAADAAYEYRFSAAMCEALGLKPPPAELTVDTFTREHAQQLRDSITIRDGKLAVIEARDYVVLLATQRVLGWRRADDERIAEEQLAEAYAICVAAWNARAGYPART